ncbi:MAG: hypothetical protein ACI90V_005382 [Bacillariaceae sp.]|jgi:hypothetical protein
MLLVCYLYAFIVSSRQDKTRQDATRRDANERREKYGKKREPFFSSSFSLISYSIRLAAPFVIALQDFRDGRTSSSLPLSYNNHNSFSRCLIILNLLPN